MICLLLHIVGTLWTTFVPTKYNQARKSLHFNTAFSLHSWSFAWTVSKFLISLAALMRMFFEFLFEFEIEELIVSRRKRGIGMNFLGLYIVLCPATSNASTSSTDEMPTYESSLELVLVPLEVIISMNLCLELRSKWHLLQGLKWNQSLGSCHRYCSWQLI